METLLSLSSCLIRSSATRNSLRSSFMRTQVVFCMVIHEDWTDMYQFIGDQVTRLLSKSKAHTNYLLYMTSCLFDTFCTVRFINGMVFRLCWAQAAIHDVHLRTKSCSGTVLISEVVIISNGQKWLDYCHNCVSFPYTVLCIVDTEIEVPSAESQQLSYVPL